MAEEEAEKKDKPEGDGKSEKAPAEPSKIKALILPAVVSAVMAAIVGSIFVFVLAPKPQAPAEESANQDGAEKKNGHGEAGAKEEKKGEGSAEHGAKDAEVPAEEGGQPAEHTGFYMQYDPFVVSVFDHEKVHYLRVKLALELESEAVKEEITAKDPQIKDSLIFVLGDFTLRELLDNQAKILLKDVLLKTMEKIVGKGKVSGIYFTEFTVQ